MADEKFKKGADPKRGPGGARVGAGRKPDVVKKALDEQLNAAIDSKIDPKKRSLVQLAWDTVAQAMIDRDENGNVTAAGAKAAKDIHDRVYGKAVEKHEVDLTNGPLLKHVADLAAAAASSEA